VELIYILHVIDHIQGNGLHAVPGNSWPHKMNALVCGYQIAQHLVQHAHSGYGQHLLGDPAVQKGGRDLHQALPCRIQLFNRSFKLSRNLYPAILCHWIHLRML